MRSNHYKLLARAISHYERCGFTHVETTWVSTKEVMMITAPSDACLTPFTDGLFLVGSGEQSFLAMIEEGKLVPGKHQTTTPCFRNEPVVDELHRRYFLKNELMVYAPKEPEKALAEMIDMSRAYLARIAKGRVVEVIASEKAGEQDITLSGIEVGSYGIRSHGEHLWVYGTGLALPRFTQAFDAATARRSSLHKQGGMVVS